MIRTAALAAAATVALAALSACGDDSSGDASSDARTTQIEAVLNAFGRDAASANGEAACARFTPTGRARYGEIYDPDADTGCEARVLVSAAMMSEEEAAAFDDFKVRRIRGAGGRVEVHDEDVDVPKGLTPQPNDKPMVFRRVDGRWLIEDLG